MLFVGTTLLVIWWNVYGESPANELDTVEVDLAQSVLNPGYVGMSACAECHAEQVAEFQNTRHAWACVPASRAAAPGFLPGKGTHATRLPDMRFEMTREDGRLMATTVRNTPQGEVRQSDELALAYGAAGKSDEMYFTWRGNGLYGHTIAWLYPSNCWGHETELFSVRGIGSRCMECHNTWLAHVPGSRNEFRRDDMILGVTCERCHGPGQEHVQHHRAHPHDPAHSIVNPGALSRERKMEVCTQCHSNSFKRRGPAFSYRPGEPLEEYFRVPETSHPEYDLVGNQVQYLRKSACFQRSEMTCVTCHDPHGHSEHEDGQRACLQCHTAAACLEQPRIPEAVRADCIGCHMPSRIWMGARFHTAHDQYLPVTRRSEHRIAIDPVARDTVVLSWLRAQDDDQYREEAKRLTEKISNYWVNESQRRSEEYRLMGSMQALREALSIDLNPATKELLDVALMRQAEFEELDNSANALDQKTGPELVAILKRILEINPNHASGYGRLGTIYQRLGNRDLAIANWKEVARHDPEDTYGLLKLAKQALAENQPREAVELFAQADEIDPYDANIQHAWALALLQLNRSSDAEKRFRSALEIDPRHTGACEGLSEALRRQGRPEEAESFARRAARLNYQAGNPHSSP